MVIITQNPSTTERKKELTGIRLDPKLAPDGGIVVKIRRVAGLA